MQRPKMSWWLSRYQKVLVAFVGCWLLGVTVCAYQAHPLNGSLYPLAFPHWVSSLALVSWGAMFFGLLLLCSSRRKALILGCLLMMVLGGGYYRFFHLTPGSQDVFFAAKGYPVRVVGECFLQSDEPSKAFLKVQTVNTQPYQGQVLIRLNRSLPAPAAGSLVMLEGRLSKPDDTDIPGAFNERRYLAALGVTAVLHHVSAIETLQQKPVSPEGHLNRVLAKARSRIAGIFKTALPLPYSQIVGGIVLGDQAITLDNEVKRRFVRTGLIHLLAASGMNVAIVSGLLFFIARLSRVPRRGQLLLAMAGALVYAFLSGMSPSVLRATAMLEIALGLKFLDKTLSNISVLMLALMAIVLWRPDLITSIGFQLSVLTTLGIMAMMPPLQRWAGFYVGSSLSGALLLPLVAQLWATPLLLYYFNELPMIGVVLNVLVIPLVSALTAIGFTAGVLGLLLQGLGGWVAKAAFPFVWGLYALVSITADWPWAQLQVAAPSPVSLFLMYAFLVAISLLMNNPASVQTCLQVFKMFKKTNFSQLVGPAVIRRPRILAAIVLLVLAFGLDVMKRQRVLAELSVLPLNHKSAAFLIEDVSLSQPVLLMPENASPWYARRVSDHLRHRNIQSVSALYWFGTGTSPALENRQKAVLDVLGSQVAIQKVYAVPMGSPVLSYGLDYALGNWRLLPGYPFWLLGYAGPEAPSAGASIQAFCLGGYNRSADTGGGKGFALVEQQLAQLCPLYYSDAQDRRLSPYQLRLSGLSDTAQTAALTGSFLKVRLLGMFGRPQLARWHVLTGL
ncbi:MAG: ComEC/Rec2 family competence protein [Vampirovibrionales bacterium]|nr:ComEC/Rec2 family competence protein [Vampirovibrionales bacterium]